MWVLSPASQLHVTSDRDIAGIIVPDCFLTSNNVDRAPGQKEANYMQVNKTPMPILTPQYPTFS
jgi:hypothetical protein